MSHLLYRCYAKVNFALEIVGKRPDGFHDLVSLIHTLNLADDLRIAPAHELITRVEGLEVATESNLVWRAAQLLMQQKGAELTLVKRIPAAAGLGGGSSDAATTLVGLNRLWGQRLRLQQLEALAAELGSDVPFFVKGGAALMQGRGEQLTPLPALKNQWLVVLVPRHSVEDKTRRLYGALRPSDFTSGDTSREAAARLQLGEPLRDADCVNGFERAAREVFAALGELWMTAEQRIGKRLHLSGAGPAMFALVGSRSEAKLAVDKLKDLGEAFSARTVKHARASINIVDA